MGSAAVEVAEAAEAVVAVAAARARSSGSDMRNSDGLCVAYSSFLFLVNKMFEYNSGGTLSQRYYHEFQRPAMHSIVAYKLLGFYVFFIILVGELGSRTNALMTKCSIY